MGSIQITANLVPGGPAVAVVLNDDQLHVAHHGHGDARRVPAFDGLAYAHRKEYARWIDEAKREETRQRRVTQALAMLREGRNRS